MMPSEEVYGTEERRQNPFVESEMQSRYFTTSHLPFLKNFSARDRELAQEALSNQEERRRKANESHSRKADELIESHHRQLHDLLGARNLAELREAMKHERLQFRDLWQPPVDLELDYRKENEARKQRLDELVRKLGTSPEKLREIGSETEERLREILTDPDGKVAPGYHMSKNLDKWTSLSPLNKLPLPWGTPPLEIDPNDPHPWFLFRPPFFGFLTGFEFVVTTNFQADRKHFTAPSSGLVGNDVWMECTDASSFDSAWVDAEAQIAFAFEAHTPGVVEVLIDAQSTMSTHYLDMEDEFGFSSSVTRQRNYLMLNVLHPNVTEPSLSLMSSFEAEFDGDDLTEQRENLTRGQHYFAQLFSSGPVPGGQPVIVTVGTKTYDTTTADDIEVKSSSDFQWFINSVGVRIAP